MIRDEQLENEVLLVVHGVFGSGTTNCHELLAIKQTGLVHVRVTKCTGDLRLILLYLPSKSDED